MSDRTDELEMLWKDDDSKQIHPQLYQAVVSQERRWYLLLSLELVAIVVGIVLPLVIVLQNPNPFWFLWALDLWGVVAVSAWFFVAKVKDMLVELHQSTSAFEHAFRRRLQLQIRASNAGILLATLQFVILPLLGWWRVSLDGAEQSDLLITYAGILAVMAIYIVVLLRVKSLSHKRIALM